MRRQPRGHASQEEAVVNERLGGDVLLGEVAPREAYGEVDQVGGEDGDEGVLVDHVEGAVGEHREHDQVVLAAGLDGQRQQNGSRLWAGTERSSGLSLGPTRRGRSSPAQRAALSERASC